MAMEYGINRRRALLGLAGGLGLLKVGIPRGVANAAGSTGFIRLNANENPLGPSPQALEAAVAALSGGNRYQDGSAVEEAIARYDQVTGNLVTLSVGASELLRVVPLAWLEPGDNAIAAQPTYGTLPRHVRMRGAELRLFPLTADHAHDLSAMARAVNARTRVVLITNPNNPTGTLTPSDRIEAFVRSLPRDVLVVIDEAYIHYALNTATRSAVSLVQAGHNVLVLRTFSKIFAMAGIRLGYGVASPAILGRLRPCMAGGMGLNAAAAAMAAPSLNDADFIKRGLQANAEGRTLLTEGLARLGMRVLPSSTNFILADLGRDASDLVRALRVRNIGVRPGLDWDLATCVRVSVGLPEENRAFVEAAREILA